MSSHFQGTKSRSMTTLERRRALLEDLELIEDAISRRFVRNPELYYSCVTKQALVDTSVELPSDSAIASNRIYKSKKAKRSQKQLVVQQHEINFFISQMLDKQKDLSALDGTVDTTGYEDSGHNFELLKQTLHDINQRYESEGETALPVNRNIAHYSMFSASRKNNTILSETARDLQVNDIFTREEQYGEFVDVGKFHPQWLSVIKSADCSLLQFFGVLEKFLDDSEYLLRPPMDRKNAKYSQFLLEISNYVEDFFNKVYILVDSNIFSQNIQRDFQEYLRTPLVHTENGCYCVACCKWFKVITVFQGHLPGKHHKRNQDKRFSHLFSEYKLHRYLQLLQKEFQRTKDFVERKLAFTAEERMEEMSRISLEYEGPDYAVGEQEEGNDKPNNRPPEKSTGRLELPLGSDGLPIPFWLYKLQGLDISYTCEICGNQSYNGRRVFERHFAESTHLFHLKCLGIVPSDAFKSISTIREAQDLWKRISGAGRTVSRDIEVEDEDGNVMTQQVYDELKKQGLV